MVGCSSSIGTVAGISVTITLLMALPVGVLIGCWGAWCVRKCNKFIRSGWYREGTHVQPKQQPQEQLQRPQEAIYEEPGPGPGPVNTAIPLKKNQAYGHASTCKGGIYN